MLPQTDNEKRTLLVIEANPDGTPPIRTSEEIRTIADAHERSKLRDDWVLKIRTGVTGTHFRRALLDYEPDMVHVGIHGAGARGSVFENESTNSIHLISNTALAGTFKLAKNVECAVLNFCNSNLQAEEVVKHIPFVIAMKSPISDSAALKFDEGFYDSVFAGEDFANACEWGINAIQSAGIAGHSAPVLRTREPGLTQSQVLVGRYYYQDLVEEPIPLGDTGFTVQRVHGLVWRIMDQATQQTTFIEYTTVDLRSDAFSRPYTSVWVFEEVQHEGAVRTGPTIETVANLKKIRRIGLDNFTLVTPDKDLLKRFEEARRNLLKVFPQGIAKWHVNEKGQLEKLIDYGNGQLPTLYIYESLLES
jgi:hypothetical protein